MIFVETTLCRLFYSANGVSKLDLFILIFLFTLSINSESQAGKDVCYEYRKGNLTENKIAVFSDLADMADRTPDRLKEIRYRVEYVKQPHIRGYFGEYPPPDFELGLGFEINIASGQPVPQNNRDYVNSYKSNPDFQVKIQNTWFTLWDHLPPKIALPIDGSINVDEYDVVGQQYGMQEISYRKAIIQKGAGNYTSRFDKETEIFFDKRQDELKSFMTCKKASTIVKLPHCNYVQIIHGFIVESRFKRYLIDDLDVIKRRSRDFVSCLFTVK